MLAKWTLPETRVEPDGTVLRRCVRPFTFTYKGQTATVDVMGYYPDGEGEGILIGDDMAPIDEALRRIKIRLGEIEPDKDAPSRPAAAE